MELRDAYVNSSVMDEGLQGAPLVGLFTLNSYHTKLGPSNGIFKVKF